MNSLVPPPPTAKPAPLAASKKVTGSFLSRKSAKEAVLALRKAGYQGKEIQILRGIPPAELEREGVYDVLSKYVRHLVSPKRILIRVAAPEIDRASLLFRNLGAEVAVNRFFHHTPAPHSAPGSALLPMRRWSE